MTAEVFQAIPLVMGLFIGAFATWLVLRERAQGAASQARAESSVELAQLQERVRRIPELESRATMLERNYAEAERQLKDLAVALAEKTQAWESAEGQRQQIAIELSATREKSEALQRQLQAEGERTATLQEQAGRLPQLEAELKAAAEREIALTGQIAELRERIGAAQSNVEASQEVVKSLTDERSALMAERSRAQADQKLLAAQVAELTARLEETQKQSEEKLALLNDAREQLSDRFKTLANEILEEKSKRFTEQNQSTLGQLLEPLKTQITEFKGKVEEVYVQEGKDRSALAEQVKQLMALNHQLSTEANNLTNALKGQSKTRGNWGELVLTRILESSGLTQGLHYQAQESHGREDGTRAQPDIILKLPEFKHLVVDSKVSLTGYEEYASSDDEDVRKAALKRHVDSVRSHIKDLSGKNYQELYKLKSLDFVVMFVPVEPAFMLAISHDDELWQDAWKKNVLLVSPSTLLFVIRTVAHLWRQEQQNQNAQEIAKCGGDLYDKLVSFVGDLEKVGERLQQAQGSFEEAKRKLASGQRGTLIRQAEKLRKLGVKPTKALPQPLLDQAFALEDDLDMPEAQALPE